MKRSKTLINSFSPKDSIISEISPIDFKVLIHNSPVAIYTLDLSGKITFFNQAAIELWGRTPDVNQDKWCGSLRSYFLDGKPIIPDNSPIAAAIRNGIVQNIAEIIIERPDSSLRIINVNTQQLFDASGELKGVQNTLLDITDYKENEIKRSTHSSIVESSDDVIISINREGIITSWNSGAERILRYSEEEIVGKSFKILIPPNRHAEEEIIMNTILKGDRVDHFETVRLDKYGVEIPLSLTVSPVKDLRGNIVGASKVARDISIRLMGEEKQAILSAIVESSDDAIVSKNLNGIIMSWNRGAEQIFGYKEKEVLGKSITILIPEERLQEEDLIISNIKKGKKVHHFETYRKGKNGREFPISLTVSPVKDARGKIIGASKIARDISKQKETQKQLKKYTQHLEILNSLASSISKKMDVQHILQQVTDATTSLTGAAFGAFFHTTITEDGIENMLYTLSGANRADFEKFGMPRNTAVFHPTFTAKKILRVDDITKDPRYGKNAPYSGMPKGHLPVCSFLSVPVISTTGKVLGGLFYGHPEPGKFKKEHEDLVINIASQAAISLDNSILFERVKNLNEKKDEFIALVSHELKTPLTTIKGYLQVLEKKDTDTVTTMFLTRSLQQVNKLNTLVEDLLNMSKVEADKLDFHIEKFDLRKLLIEMIETFTYSNTTHKLLYEMGNDPIIIKGDKQRIEQAIINIMNNAVKYSPQEDKINLKVSVDSKSAYISIKDYGIGLTEKDKTQLFSRYYRSENTKGISGLGIGLYLTKTIMDRHEGKIEVTSELNHGSEFCISLPIDPIDQD